jgi:aspartyl-tRNA(Asn)/glutamyl-tRNA(Gln) amidotransferase subunit A
MSANELLQLDVTALAGLLRTRAASAVEVTAAYLDRIAAVDRQLGSYLTVTAELALAAARAADVAAAKRDLLGPLHGIPIGLKDLIYTRGIDTTAGSPALAGFKPDYDATVWTRLASAGAVLLGKLNLNEFAYGGLNKACHNPYALDRLPGGSSAGSGAAVAGRTAAAALGTDTSGSIRIPASACGCVGLKPTYGRVSRHGVIPLAASMDCVGPMTRSVRDSAVLLATIAGHDAEDSTSAREPLPDFVAAAGEDVKGLRVGVIRELKDGIAPEVDGLFKASLRGLTDLGATVDEVSIPSLELGAMINAIVTWVEALEYHQTRLTEHPGLYGANCRLQLETGMMVPATSYVRAQRGRARVLAQTLAALDKHDVLVSPGAAATATLAADLAGMNAKAAADSGYRDMLRFTQPFDATGQPALTVPTGLTREGLPASIQVVGRPFDEAMLFRVGAAIEAARGPLPAAQLSPSALV